MFKLTVAEANEEFDKLKLNRDYEGIIKLLKVNSLMLIDAGWDVSALINRCQRIINLENSL